VSGSSISWATGKSASRSIQITMPAPHKKRLSTMYSNVVWMYQLTEPRYITFGNKQPICICGFTCMTQANIEINRLTVLMNDIICLNLWCLDLKYCFTCYYWNVIQTVFSTDSDLFVRWNGIGCCGDYTRYYYTSFLHAGCPSCRQPTVSKHWRQQNLQAVNMKSCWK